MACAGLILFALALFAAANLLQPVGAVGAAHSESFLHGFHFGLFTSIVAMLGALIVKYTLALRSDEKLRALYISETDERKRFIAEKTGGIGYAIVAMSLGLACIVSVYFSPAVFWTLFVVLMFVGLVKLVVMAYCKLKY